MSEFCLTRGGARHALTYCAATVVATLAWPASAQEGADRKTSLQTLPVVSVSANREGGALDTLSRNVTVISRKEILEQAATADSLAEILGKMVPGMAPSSQTLTNSQQTLRGRDVLVLIDGVPMQTSRNVSRDLFNISPAEIESIEVVHGGSAAYGGGAAGGIIYINTLRPEAGKLALETTVGVSSSLTRLESDALAGQLGQKLSGTTGPVDYLLSISAEQTQGFFDAKGDRIPPEPSQGDLSDTRTLDFLGKLGYDFGDQRVQLTASYLDARQDTDFISDPAVNAAPPGTVKARALKGLELDDQTRNQNLFVNLDYSKQDLLGSKLRMQAYYRDYHTRFFPFDGRRFGGWNALAQTFLSSQVYGGRLTVDTPVTPLKAVGAKLLWGADVNREKTGQPAAIFDGAAFDASGGRRFVEIDDKRTFVPLTTTDTVGVFGQLELVPTDWLILRGGVRHDWTDVSFDDYTTLGQGNRIEGGRIDYSETTVNAGAVFMPSDAIDLYANYSQSFELPDIGLQLRFAPAGFSVNDANLKPRITDNYEVGIRGHSGGFNANLAAFYSESNRGRVVIEDFSLAQERTPEQIYGVELSADYALTRAVTIGGTAAWLKGTRKNPATGEKEALNSLQIPPLKLTGFVEYSPYHWWTLRLQALYSGNRDDAFEDNPTGFGNREVKHYTVVDLYNRFEVGPGTLRVGVENLLNNQYYTVFGQLLRDGANTSHLAARGATAHVSYAFR
ncbi:MAG TPA: TonB-dependent receptor, partial [Nitrococcus sp.]|nr:TonB-dependent receptor [Nitrococcus sp.]